MIEVYLALGLNHRGEKIPLFWHSDRDVLRHWMRHWLSAQKPDYWVSVSEIVTVTRAALMDEGDLVEVSGLKF